MLSMDHPGICELVDWSFEVESEWGELQPQRRWLPTLEEAKKQLQLASGKPPHLLHINIPSLFRLVLCIGGVLGSFRVIRLQEADMVPVVPNQIWKARSNQRYTDETHGFYSIGHCPDIPPEDLLPTEWMIELAMLVLSHQKLPDQLSWVEESPPIRGEEKIRDNTIPF